MLEDRRKSLILMISVCLLYVGARLWRLGDTCLWFDEIFSVHAAEHDWSSLFRFVAQDLIHPPLFYIVLKSWIGIGGESVFWLRLLPVLFSAVAIFPFVRLCRELKLKTSVILLSLFLLAINGSLIKYTQTVRMYSMLMCLALFSMWLFARYFNRGKSFVPLLIVNLLLVHTHYFGWLVIGSELMAILLFQRIKWRRAIVMLGIVAACFIPWLIAVVQAGRNGSDLAQNIAWQPRPGIRELISFAIDLVEPFYFQASSAQPASIYLVTIPLLLISLVTIAVYVIEWKYEEFKQSVYFLLLFVTTPFIIAFVASWLLPHSVWGTRHLIVILPPAAVLLANALLGLRTRVLSIAAITAIGLLTAAAFYLNVRRDPPRHVWCEWNEVAADIRTKDTSAKIYTFENLVAYHVWFALRDSDRFQVGLVKGVDVRRDDGTYFLPRGFDGVQRLGPDEITGDKIWLAFRTTKTGEEGPLMETFKRLGFSACPSTQAKFGSTTVFWLEMTKRPGSCDE